MKKSNLFAIFAFMESEKKLYPMRFSPLQDGTSEVQLADLGYMESEVRNGFLAADVLGDIMDTYMDAVVGEDVFAWYGRQFPLMVSSLKGEVPVTVCPDDTTARQRWDLLGKAKLWYVVSAGPDARIGIGFEQGVSAAQLYDACLGGGVRDLLHSFAPRAGEAYVIRPGTLHAAWGGVTLLQIAQSSPLDFPLEGGGEEEGLTLEEAMDFIDYRAWRPEEAFAARDGMRPLAREDAFSISEITLREPLQIRGGGAYSLYSCVCGAAHIQYTDAGIRQAVPFTAGETVLVPADTETFLLVPDEERTLLLETVSPRRGDNAEGMALAEGWGDDDATDSADDIEYAN